MGPHVSLELACLAETLNIKDQAIFLIQDNIGIKYLDSPFPQTSQVLALDPSWTARCRRKPVFVLSTFEIDQNDAG